MTPEMRMELKQTVSALSLRRAMAWSQIHGTPDCDRCGKPLLQQKRKRFCSDRCRKRWNDLYAGYEAAA